MNVLVCSLTLDELLLPSEGLLKAGANIRDRRVLLRTSLNECRQGEKRERLLGRHHITATRPARHTINWLGWEGKLFCLLLRLLPLRSQSNVDLNDGNSIQHSISLLLQSYRILMILRRENKKEWFHKEGGKDETANNKKKCFKWIKMKEAKRKIMLTKTRSE